MSGTALALLTRIPYLAGHCLDDASSSFLDTLVFEQDLAGYDPGRSFFLAEAFREGDLAIHEVRPPP